jgi:hypothetical protein
VQGQVYFDAAGITFLHGTGFTGQVVMAPGPIPLLSITLTDPALINPSVVAATDPAGFGLFIQSQSGSNFVLTTGTDSVVNFIAIGPCPPSDNPPPV